MLRRGQYPDHGSWRLILDLSLSPFILGTFASKLPENMSVTNYIAFSFLKLSIQVPVYGIILFALIQTKIVAYEYANQSTFIYYLNSLSCVKAKSNRLDSYCT